MSDISENQIQIAGDENTSYSSLQPNADISNGTVNRDLLDVISQQLAQIYLTLQSTKDDASLKNISSFSPEALSIFALNYNVLINQATPATGNVVFQAKKLPSYPISIPINTIIETPPLQNNSVIQYFTTVNATFDSLTASFNSNTGYYELSVSVQSVLSGTAYNVGNHALTILVNHISGIDAVDNQNPINNATDIDTNSVVAKNILTATANTNLGTITGYEDLISANFDVSGVSVVSPFDPDNLRVQYGNEADIPVISVNATSFTTILTTQGTPLTIFTDTRPVLSVSSVVGTTNGINYISGVDYAFSKDKSSVYGYSSISYDGLTWFIPPPGQGMQITVQGQYDQTVNKIQSYITELVRKYVTADLLAKRAILVPINISVTVSATSGTDSTILKSNINSALTSALNGYSLGQNVDEDDLVNVINAVTGVGAIQIPFTLIQRNDTLVFGQAITISKYEYARPGTLNITIQ